MILLMALFIRDVYSALFSVESMAVEPDFAIKAT